MPNSSHPTPARPPSEQNGVAASGDGGAADSQPQDESLYSKLVNSLGGIVWEADGETFQFTFVSPQAERILGYPVEQWLSEPNFWRKHTHPDDADWCSAYCLDSTAQRRDHEFKYRMFAADGRVVWLQDIVSVKVEDDGSVRLRGIMIDITQAKLAEEALRKSEQNFRKAFYTSPAPAVIVRIRDRRWLNVNSAFGRTFGYAAEEVVGKTGAALGIWADAREQDEFWRRFLAEKAINGCETRLVAQSGAVIDSLLYVQAIELSGEECLLTSIIDITERKRAEESLRLSEERFAKAFHASPEPISIYRSQDTVILEVNERWTSVYGYTREEAVGHTALELNLVEPRGGEKLRRLLEKQGSLREYEMDFRTKWGDVRHSSVSAEKIVINDELCYIFLHRDVTERRRAEQENLRLIHRLGERVKELTALHHTARALQDGSKSVPELLQEIVALLPPAWQYPEVTAARIAFGAMEFRTENYARTRWSQAAEFTSAGMEGRVEVVYLEERPAAHAGPFLLEERNLIDSLAEMLRLALNRRYAQEALRESEERFRQVTDNVREVLWLYEPDYGKALYVSPAYESVWGRTRASLYQDPDSFLDAVHPDDRARVEEAVRRVREREFDHEYRIVKSDGAVRWIWDRGFPIRDREGRVYRVAGIAEDITERKKSEGLLITSREQLRALSESLRRAKEEEGIRIARELHDELGSALTSMKWSLLKLEEVGPEGGGAGAREKIAEMVGLVDTTINTVRRISSELRPGVLDDLGLVAAIEWHAQQFQEHAGIVCRLDSLVDNVELNREQATAVFRIFQEAMTNVLRHARATKVNIIMEEEECEFVLEIKDNGRGITESEKLGIHSLGLLGMRERAHSVGGKVEINGAAGKGTVVIVRLPVAGGATS